MSSDIKTLLLALIAAAAFIGAAMVAVTPTKAEGFKDTIYAQR